MQPQSPLRTAEWAALLSALLLAAPTAAQVPAGASVAGRVLDAADQPLPFASALLLHLPDSAVTQALPTDEQGAYAFAAVQPGRYCVKATMVSYRSARSAAFDVAAAAVTVPALTLAEQSTVLQGVTVQGQPPVLDQQADRLVLNVEKLNTAGDNALDVLTKLPGVRLDQSDNLVLRGSTGLNVMVDSKMTYLAGAALSNYLRSLPASALRRVELIGNPPAAYDAAGTAGVLNLELKRSQQPGLQGTARAGLGRGRYAKAWGGTSLSYNAGPLRLFARLDLNHDETFNRLLITRRVNDTLYRQENFWSPTSRRLSYATGADWALAPSHTLGLQLRGAREPQRARVSGQTLLFDAENPAGAVTLRSPQTSTEANRGLNLNYRWQLDTLGRELGFDADYVRFTDDRAQDFANTYFSGAGEGGRAFEQLRSSQAADVRIRAAKADYRQPLPGGQLETGWKSSWVRTKSAVRFDERRADTWQLDPRRTNDFRYDEQIHAAYFSLSRTRGKLETKAGLRAEQTVSDAFSPTTGQQVRRRYLQVFPSVFVNYQLTENDQFGASLSRRITRPNYQRLNPFEYYTDAYTVVAGNPFLGPALSNSAQFNYAHKNFQVLRLSYLHERGAVHDVVFQNDATGRTTNSPRNLARTTNLRLSSGGHFELTKWWSTDNQVSSFYNRVRSGLAEAAFDQRQFSWGFSSEHNFTLPKDFSLQLTALYESPQVVGVYRARTYSGVNLGIKKQVWQKRGTISLRANDIFYDNYVRAVIRYNNVDMTWTNQMETRRVWVALSYQFGDAKLKTARIREGVDEESRLRR